MTEPADKRLPIKASTKDLIDEHKPEGWTYDYWCRRQLGVADE